MVIRTIEGTLSYLDSSRSYLECQKNDISRLSTLLSVRKITALPTPPIFSLLQSPPHHSQALELIK